MPLLANPSVTPNITSTNARRLDAINQVSTTGEALSIGPLPVAGQGRAVCAFSIQQPHPQLRAVFSSQGTGASVTLGNLQIPASAGTGQTNVVYEAAQTGVSVSLVLIEPTASLGFTAAAMSLMSMTA